MSKVVSALKQEGLSVQVVNGMLLQVAGSAAAVERAFGVQLHQFQAGANVFHAPVGAQHLPPAIASEVAGVVGLDTRPRYAPHLHRLPAAVRQHVTPTGVSNVNATPDAPGEWTVKDFAQYYNVTPLYTRGVTGAGRTIGIVTLASFTPSDAFAYWKSLGLAVDPNRITVVKVDGGAGKPSDASGSDETTLDVEQSGGIAPAAKIIVYVAPNTDKAFLDAWARAVSDNLADAVSTSWGECEEFLVQGQRALGRSSRVRLVHRRSGRHDPSRRAEVHALERERLQRQRHQGARLELGLPDRPLRGPRLRPGEAAASSRSAAAAASAPCSTFRTSRPVRRTCAPPSRTRCCRTTARTRRPST